MKSLAFILCAAMGVSLHAAEPADTNYDEQTVPAYSLPPLWPSEFDGEAARSLWQTSRRAEIISLFEQHVYGKTPQAPIVVRSELLEESANALDGIAIRRQVRLTISPSPENTELDPDRSIQFELLIYTPKNVDGRVAAFIGLNFYGNQAVHPEREIRISQQWMSGNPEIGIVNNRATESTRGAYQHRWQPESVIN